jgi:hypothetical protein
MPNSAYHKLPDNSYMNIAEPGGPVMWRVQQHTDGQWYAQFSWDSINYVLFPTPFNTIIAAQAALDNVIQQINSGSFGP